MADNHNPTPQDLEALDALMRRALLLGEYHRFMDGVSLVYLHRVVQAARREDDDRLRIAVEAMMATIGRATCPMPMFTLNVGFPEAHRAVTEALKAEGRS